MEGERGYSFETAVNMLMEHINCTEKEAIDILEALESEVAEDKGQVMGE